MSENKFSHLQRALRSRRIYTHPETGDPLPNQVRADELCPHPNNPKIHPEKQHQAVAGSLDTLGQIDPLKINIRNGYLVDGHERAWLALGYADDTMVDVIFVDLSEAEHKLALSVYDETRSYAYDREALDSLLREVKVDDARLQTMLSEMASSQGLTYGQNKNLFENDTVDIDKAGDLLKNKWDVQEGDIWVIPSQTATYPHRLMCGDSLSFTHRDTLLDGLTEYCFFSDPMYQDHIIKELSMVWDFTHTVFLTGGKMLREVLDIIPTWSDGAIVPDVDADTFEKGILLNVKTGVQKGNYKRPQYIHRNIIWVSPTINFGPGYNSVIRSSEGARIKHGGVYHYYAKAVDAIEMVLKPFQQDVIVDGFAGAGTSFLSCERLNKTCYGMELDPLYCACILERLESLNFKPERLVSHSVL